MATVISHFYNEAYLLPWWLKHHLSLFDFGIMIDHGSTDSSVDIIRELAPHWRVVKSSSVDFDAFFTDFEVMNYEQQIPGWKIVLNITEFLAPACDLSKIISKLEKAGRIGCSCTGIICVDLKPEQLPNYDQALITQKVWGFDENIALTDNERIAMGLSVPWRGRNRFFHRNLIGMYVPGRHRSYHPDSNGRIRELMVFHYGFSPWNPETIKRKIQIKEKVSRIDSAACNGLGHLRSVEELEVIYKRQADKAIDLRVLPFTREAIERFI